MLEDFITRLKGALGGELALNVLSAIGILIVGFIICKLLLAISRGVLSRTKLDPIVVNFILSIAKVVLYTFIFVPALEKLGFNTNSIVAMLGAAGLAVGLALQGSLQNFASGVLLIVFKPFKAGDFVEVSGISGVVENINIFSTTLRSGDNKEIIVANGSIYGNTIINYSKRETRRVDMVFGISYGDDLLKAKEVIWSVLKKDERILQDPAPVVNVAELGDSSVNFNVRPWVKTAEYWDVRASVIENIKLAFDANGISIPFPQMDVHLDK